MRGREQEQPTVSLPRKSFFMKALCQVVFSVLSRNLSTKGVESFLSQPHSSGWFMLTSDWQRWAEAEKASPSSYPAVTGLSLLPFDQHQVS